MNVVRMLIERGADMAAENIFWETAIPMAMRYGKLEIARILIEDVTVQSKYGGTPITHAPAAASPLPYPGARYPYSK
jgi:hypothetical protein